MSLNAHILLLELSLLLDLHVIQLLRESLDNELLVLKLLFQVQVLLLLELLAGGDVSPFLQFILQFCHFESVCGFLRFDLVRLKFLDLFDLISQLVPLYR